MNSPRSRSGLSNSDVIARSGATKQSRQTGLLRFARNDGAVIRSHAMRLILLLSFPLLPLAASAQTCPEPLASARRLVLVTPDTWTSSTAEVQRFSHGSPKHAWMLDSGPVSARLVGGAAPFGASRRAGEAGGRRPRARRIFQNRPQFWICAFIAARLFANPAAHGLRERPAQPGLRRATRSVPRRAPKTCG
jgi:hypothetical protein